MADFGELSRAAHPVEAGGDLCMAFQPILDVARGSVYGYEALARRPGGSTAADVFRGLEGRELARMERRLLWEAMSAAAGLELPGFLSVNLGSTLIGDESGLTYLTDMAARAGLTPGKIVFEFPEHLPIDVAAWVAGHRLLRNAGFRTAIDDLGGGYASLSVLAAYVPDIVKLDLKLIQGIALTDQRVRRKVVSHVATMAQDLGAEVVAEGVESVEDAETLLKVGVYLQQGYVHGRPRIMRAEATDQLAGRGNFGPLMGNMS